MIFETISKTRNKRLLLHARTEPTPAPGQFRPGRGRFWRDSGVQQETQETDYTLHTTTDDYRSVIIEIFFFQQFNEVSAEFFHPKFIDKFKVPNTLEDGANTHLW